MAEIVAIEGLSLQAQQKRESPPGALPPQDPTSRQKEEFGIGAERGKNKKVLSLRSLLNFLINHLVFAQGVGNRVDDSYPAFVESNYPTTF